MTYKYLLYRIIGLIIALFFLIDSILDYRDFKEGILKLKPVEYKILSLDRSSGRGGGYNMKIECKNKIDNISISTEELSMISIEKPKLYYSVKRDDFFTEYIIETGFNGVILFLLLSVFIIFPWEFLYENNRKKGRKIKIFWSWF